MYRNFIPVKEHLDEKRFIFFSKTKVLSFVCFLIIFISSCGGKSVQLSCGFNETSELAINHLQPFIDAMEKYKADNGKYPQNGLELIPKYLDKVPVIAIRGRTLDDPQVEVLSTDKIDSYDASFAEDGSSFSVKFYPHDDRICLLGGRNNICEYTSQTKKWGCYMH